MKVEDVLLLFESVKKASHVMKKFVLKFLPALAFVFAASVALVANASTAKPEGVLKAKVNGAWQPISESQAHNCSNSSDECTARFNGSQMIPNTLVPGTYIP